MTRATAKPSARRVTRKRSAEAADAPPSLAFVTEAIFGLLGVIVGGLLNGGVGLFTEHRRRKAEAKVAARLLYSEIEGNQLTSYLTLSAGKWTHAKVGFSVEEWNLHRTVLASVLSDDDWTAMDNYYATAVTLALMLTHAEADSPVDAQGQANLEGMRKRGNEARKVILRYAGTDVSPLDEEVRWGLTAEGEPPEGN